MFLFSLEKAKGGSSSCLYSLLGGYGEDAARLLRAMQRRMGGSAQGVPVRYKKKNYFTESGPTLKKFSGQGVGCPSLKIHKTEYGSEQPVLTRTSLGK